MNTNNLKKTIERLKDITGHKSDKSFADAFGYSKDTITRAKRGENTKLETPLTVLENILNMLTPEQMQVFLKDFKKMSKPILPGQPWRDTP